MSLIVGAIHNSEISLSADTKLTPGTEWATGEPKEGLKIFFLDRTIAISYSGSLVAHDVICDSARLRKKGANLPEILSYVASQRDRLRIEPRTSLNQVPDFLVAVAGAPPQLYRISDDYAPVDAGLLSCIGDNTAVSHFRLLAEQRSIRTISSVRDGLRHIIQSRDHPTVGGYVVTAHATQTGFKFLAEMSLTSPRATPDAAADWQAIDFGTAESGGFGFISVVPTEPGKNGYGLYFYQGHWGVFYHVDLLKNLFERLTGFASSASGFAKLVSDGIGDATEAFGELGAPQS